MRWTSSRRRLAAKPTLRSSSRFSMRRPMAKSRVSLIVVSVRSACPCGSTGVHHFYRPLSTDIFRQGLPIHLGGLRRSLVSTTVSQTRERGRQDSVRRRRKLLPAPLWGGDGGGGRGAWYRGAILHDPPPIPPPQGGREESAGPANRILSAHEVSDQFYDALAWCAASGLWWRPACQLRGDNLP
jgi:hypothetical protein